MVVAAETMGTPESAQVSQINGRYLVPTVRLDEATRFAARRSPGILRVCAPISVEGNAVHVEEVFVGIGKVV